MAQLRSEINMAEVLSAIDCAFAGKPHPLINTLTPEQRFLRYINERAAFYPPTREQVARRNEPSIGLPEVRRDYQGD